MGYLERLKKSANAGAGTLKNQNNPEAEGLLGSLGTPPGPFQKIEGATVANDPGQKQTLARHAATLAEGLSAYTAAMVTEPARHHESGTEERSTPTLLPRNAPTASCRTCRHLKRPGLSDGHCGGRDDLKPAYGPEHPLRRIPDDRGTTCVTWILHD